MLTKYDYKPEFNEVLLKNQLSTEALLFFFCFLLHPVFTREIHLNKYLTGFLIIEKQHESAKINDAAILCKIYKIKLFTT